MSDGRWHLAVVFTCISLVIVTLSIFSETCWLPVRLLWKNVYSVPIGEDVGKLEALHTVGGNGNWFSHYEKQHVVSSKD